MRKHLAVNYTNIDCYFVGNDISKHHRNFICNYLAVKFGNYLAAKFGDHLAVINGHHLAVKFGNYLAVKFGDHIAVIIGYDVTIIISYDVAVYNCHEQPVSVTIINCDVDRDIVWIIHWHFVINYVRINNRHFDGYN
jgi:hypothetical protein